MVKLSGFTFIRNAVSLDYPVMESISSILPIVDEFIHENDLPAIMSHVDRYADDDRVDGLAFTELSFWGDYKTVVNVYPQRKRKRCRIVKPHHFVMSRGDAAGFTVHPQYKEKGRRMRV